MTISRTYARLVGDSVREVIVSDVSPNTLYHGDVLWMDCTATPGVTVGWTVIGTTFSPPAPVPLTVVQAQAALGVKLAQLELAGVGFGGKFVAVDSSSQVKLVSGFAMASAGFWVDGTPWIATDGTLIPLAKSDIEALAPKAGSYVAGLTGRYAALMAELVANPAADISAGWPSNV